MLFRSLERISQTVEITKYTVDIEEKGVKLKLTIVDTPGFGDAVNNTEWYASVRLPVTAVNSMILSWVFHDLIGCMLPAGGPSQTTSISSLSSTSETRAD